MNISLVKSLCADNKRSVHTNARSHSHIAWSGVLFVTHSDAEKIHTCFILMAFVNEQTALQLRALHSIHSFLHSKMMERKQSMRTFFPFVRIHTSLCIRISLVSLSLSRFYLIYLFSALFLFLLLIIHFALLCFSCCFWCVQPSIWRHDPDVLWTNAAVVVAVCHEYTCTRLPMFVFVWYQEWSSKTKNEERSGMEWKREKK